MQIKTVKDMLQAHPVFRGFDDDSLTLIAGCGRNERYKAGSFIFREGDDADKVYMLRGGDVAIEMSAPGKGALIVETLHAGEILGWSWLIPPYRHMSDARAVTDVSAVSLDAQCVRGKCDDEPMLGYQMFQEWIPHLASRVRAQRLQLLDLYGSNAR